MTPSRKTAEQSLLARAINREEDDHEQDEVGRSAADLNEAADGELNAKDEVGED